MSTKKIALVTGSTRGIGVAIAKSLAQKNCDVIITGLGDEVTIEQIKTEIETKYGVKATYVAGDLSNSDEVTAMCKKILDIYPEGIDILINNAATGIWDAYPMEHFPLDTWNKILAVNLTAPFMLIQSFLPGMKKKGWGRIVNIASIEGLIGTKHKLCPYTTTKHGIVGMSKSVAMENAENGITCNSVCPTSVSGTGMIDNWYEQMIKHRGEEYRQRVSKEQFEKNIALRNPTQKNCTPDQVADLVQFLCFSVASDQMTAGSYVIDGGFTAQ